MLVNDCVQSRSKGADKLTFLMICDMITYKENRLTGGHSGRKETARKQGG